MRVSSWGMVVGGGRVGEEGGIPKMASMMWSVEEVAEWKSSVKGMERFWSWVVRR